MRLYTIDPKDFTDSQWKELVESSTLGNTSGKDRRTAKPIQHTRPYIELAIEQLVWRVAEVYQVREVHAGDSLVGDLKAAADILRNLLVVRKPKESNQVKSTAKSVVKEEEEPKQEAKQEPKQDLTRPTVRVTVPNVKLQLKDLAFLRSLVNEEGVRCHAGRGVEDRLLLLNLIAYANRPPAQRIIDEAQRLTDNLLVKLAAATAAQDWKLVSDLGYNLGSEKRRMQPREILVLTKKGEELLAHGEISVKIRKVGCV